MNSEYFIRTGLLYEGSSIEIEKRGDHYTVRADTPTGEREFVAGLVVHSAGQVPAVADLDLAVAGVDYSGTTIKLNEYLQSISNPAVYAAGDAANTGFPLTPIAAMEGRVMAAKLLQGNHSSPLRACRWRRSPSASVICRKPPSTAPSKKSS